MRCPADRVHDPNLMADNSEELLRVFVDQAPVAIAMLDRDLRYVAASCRWRSDYAFVSKNIRGLSHYDLFPDMPERWREMHQRALNGEIISCDEDRFDRADGGVQWLRSEVRPWYANGGQGGFTIFAEDITRRIRERETSRQLNADLESRLQQAVAEAERLRRELRENFPALR